jgi:citrate lyase subunit beta / citryl-CoA lyase
MTVLPLTWLYVPADRPDRVEKAIASRAHAVIVDLEDGVVPRAKATARAGLAALLAERRDKPVYVRINAGDAEDLEAVAGLGVFWVFFV